MKRVNSSGSLSTLRTMSTLHTMELTGELLLVIPCPSVLDRKIGIQGSAKLGEVEVIINFPWPTPGCTLAFYRF